MSTVSLVVSKCSISFVYTIFTCSYPVFAEEVKRGLPALEITQEERKDSHVGCLVALAIFAVFIIIGAIGSKVSKFDAPDSKVSTTQEQTVSAPTPAPVPQEPVVQPTPSFNTSAVLGQFKKLVESGKTTHVFDKGKWDEEQYPLAFLARKAGNIGYTKDEGKTVVLASRRVKEGGLLVAVNLDFDDTKIKVTMLTDTKTWSTEERQVIYAIGSREMELLLQAIFQNKDDLSNAWSKLNNLWASFTEDEKLTIERVEQAGYRLTLSRAANSSMYFWIEKLAN